MSHPRTINRSEIKNRFFEKIEYDLDKLGEHEYYTVCENCRSIKHIDNSYQESDTYYIKHDDGVKIWKAVYDLTEPAYVDVIVRMDSSTRYYCSKECQVVHHL